MKPLFVAAALSLFTTPAMAEVQIASNGPLVSLSVQETVKSAPDIATVSAGVTSRASTAVEAMRINAAAMEKVVARIKALGVPAADIQTEGVQLGAQYDYQPNQQPRFNGYAATNRVSVRLRKIGETGKVLDSLVEAGATDINGPTFSIDNETAARAAARKNAVARLDAMAREYARGAGYAGVKLLEISETLSGERPFQARTGDIVVTSAKAEATPIEPGMVGSGVVVSASYEMTR